MRRLRIGLIGDLHGSWDAEDVLAFNASDYDLLLLTGDLGSGTAKNGLQIAQSVSQLTKRAIVMPGNNDAPYLAEIAAEFGHQRGLAAILDLRKGVTSHHAQVILCGYRVHQLSLAGRELSVLTGRPCAMGGGEFSFQDDVARNYGVHDMEESTRKLRELVEHVDTQDLLILGHNGPYGLGERAADLWGRDFRPEQGDWGDPDLAEAIAHAKERGHRLTVVAGHMHHRLRDGGQRAWQVERDGVLYVNPARVPRIRPGGDRELRYHVALEIDEHAMVASEIEWTIP